MKTLSLLDHLDTRAPDIALGEMARLAALDKAITRRLLAATTAKGSVEQNPINRS